MDSYPKSVAELIEEFEKLPSIGHKTAVRLAFHVLNSPMENAKQFSDAIINAKVSTKFCSICGNMSEADTCGICGNEKRDKSKICVVSVHFVRFVHIKVVTYFFRCEQIICSVCSYRFKFGVFGMIVVYCGINEYLSVDFEFSSISCHKTYCRGNVSSGAISRKNYI
jgi:hypothetical protein